MDESGLAVCHDVGLLTATTMPRGERPALRPSGLVAPRSLDSRNAGPSPQPSVIGRKLVASVARCQIESSALNWAKQDHGLCRLRKRLKLQLPVPSGQLGQHRSDLWKRRGASRILVARARKSSVNRATELIAYYDLLSHSAPPVAQGTVHIRRSFAALPPTWNSTHFQRFSAV